MGLSLQAGLSRGVRLGYTPARRQVAGADRDRLGCPSPLIDTTWATSKTSPDTFVRWWGLGCAVSAWGING